MDDPTRARLSDVNRRFYDRHGLDFASRRPRPWPGWTHLLPYLRERGLSEAPRVLDVGCGHGRFLRHLHAEALRPRYVGVDFSLPLLVEARRGLPNGSRELQLVGADVNVALPLAESFDLVVAFGLLHHIPGRERRLAFIRHLQSLVVPGGWIVLTFWFADEKRRSRAFEIESQSAGGGEAGDVLLPWGNEATATEDAMRYCHFFSDGELDQIEREMGWGAAFRFRDDGRENRENEYLVVSAPSTRENFPPLLPRATSRRAT